MKPEFEIFLSDQSDAFYNLALEEVLLQNSINGNIKKEIILLYKNRPSVVLGKNQSVWEEVNTSFCRENDVQIVRRLSGGGTVYHDLGNINFCYITNREFSHVSNFAEFNRPIIQFLNKLNITAEMNERKDIIIGGNKISGNAQNIKGNKMISHATLLFDADLQNVSKCLHHQFDSVKTKAIKSYRSKVTNVKDHLKSPIEREDFFQLLLEFFKKYFNADLYKSSESLADEVKELMQKKYSRKDWILGNSPKTEITYKNSKGSNGSVLVEKGKVTQLEINKNSTLKELLKNSMTNEFLWYDDLNLKFQEIKNSENRLLAINFLKGLGI